jgi:putative transposase
LSSGTHTPRPLGGLHRNPTGAWLTQQARNLRFTGLFEWVRFLIHDRDSKFSGAFDGVFRSEDINVIHRPIRDPQANAYALRPAPFAPNVSTGS